MFDIYNGFVKIMMNIVLQNQQRIASQNTLLIQSITFCQHSMQISSDM